MNPFQNVASKKKTKLTVLANSKDKGINETFRRIEGLNPQNLFDVLPTLVDVSTANTLATIEGVEKLIPNLIIELPERKYAFPLSKGMPSTLEELNAIVQSDKFWDCQFYLSKKYMYVEGEIVDPVGKPSGPEYLSFGLPAGVELIDERSTVPVAAGAKP